MNLGWLLMIPNVFFYYKVIEIEALLLVHVKESEGGETDAPH